MNAIEELIDLRARKRMLERQITAAEQAVIDAASNELPELGGQRTMEMGDHRVTIKRPVTASVSDDWYDIAAELPDDVCSVVKVSQRLSVDKVGLRWIKENRPDVMPTLARAITEKPGKISVEIKA